MPRITEDVLAAARRGDGDAFAVLWQELAPLVMGYLRARGVTDPEAVTSDVFLALLPRLSELRGGVAGLRTFVFSVAHARMVDESRRRARTPDQVEFDTALHDGSVPSAEHDALERLATNDVLSLLERLTSDYREVLALRVVADLDLEQTALVMGRSVGSVKQLQRRALLALRAEVYADGPAVVGVTAARVTPSTSDAMTVTS